MRTMALAAALAATVGVSSQAWAQERPAVNEPSKAALGQTAPPADAKPLPDIPPPGEPAVWRGEGTYRSSSMWGSLFHSSWGQVYFHRAGASIAQHNADLRGCVEDAKRFVQPGVKYPNYSGGNLLAYAIVEGVATAINDRKARPPNVENCMVSHGWEVVGLPEDEGKALRALKPEDLSAKLADMVGAAHPPGAVVRYFSNETALSSDPFFGSIGFGDHSLSFVALPADKPAADATVDKPDKPKTPWYMPAAARPPKPLTLDMIGQVPEGQALVLVGFLGDYPGNTLIFEREGETLETPAWADGRPGSFEAVRPARKRKEAKGAGAIAAFLVPAGRWSLAQVNQDANWDSWGIRFCYGAPGFELKAGEVVFAGSFESKGPFVPSMDIGPAKEALADKPELQARLHAIAYQNGRRLLCAGRGYAYALEFPETPFVEGYSLGSKARPPAEPKSDKASTPTAAAAGG